MKIDEFEAVGGSATSNRSCMINVGRRVKGQVADKLSETVLVRKGRADKSKLTGSNTRKPHMPM